MQKMYLFTARTLTKYLNTPLGEKTSPQAKLHKMTFMEAAVFWSQEICWQIDMEVSER